MSASFIARPDSIALTDPASEYEVHLNCILVQSSSVPVTHCIWNSSSHGGIDKDSIIWGDGAVSIATFQLFERGCSLHI